MSKKQISDFVELPTEILQRLNELCPIMELFNDCDIISIEALRHKCLAIEFQDVFRVSEIGSDNPFIIKGKSRLRGANTHGLVNIKDNGQSYVGYCLFETNVVSAYQALREVQYMVKDKENERQT
ncbi:unnamed protein product [Rotaria socialis]|uniref:Uncharacterized protein n=1 Tax=Rotaria socialis TaxID=392032 RepID=A0A817SPA8_9BILA|nr:unnamed protein product [Rotaria socialis]CAF3662993.1 unnamed protein product [Rotaria socialis]